MLEKKLGGVGKNTHGRASPWLVDGRLLSGSLHGREKEAGGAGRGGGAKRERKRENNPVSLLITALLPP